MAFCVYHNSKEVDYFRRQVDVRRHPCGAAEDIYVRIVDAD